MPTISPATTVSVPMAVLQPMNKRKLLKLMSQLQKTYLLVRLLKLQNSAILFI